MMVGNLLSYATEDGKQNERSYYPIETTTTSYHKFVEERNLLLVYCSEGNKKKVEMKLVT